MWKFLISNSYSSKQHISSMLDCIFNKHPFGVCSLIIFLFWLPYIITFFPGILQTDALAALNDHYYRAFTWTTHYPPLTVLLMGYTMDIGKALGSDNLGCFIYIVPQTFFWILSLSYSFVFFKKWQTPYWLRISTLLFFSLFPAFPMYAIMENKDTNYYILFLLLLYCLLLFIEEKQTKYFIFIVVITSLFCLIRNDGKFVCIFVIAIILLYHSKLCVHWLHVESALVLGILIASVSTSFMCDFYSIKPGSIREALSLPLQQTARYIYDYNSEITPEEESVLAEIFTRTDLENLYEPDRSDPVKARVRHDITTNELIPYINLWTNQFFKHPGCYFAATFNMTYGYFYIDRPEYYGYGFQVENNNEIHSEPSKYVMIKNLPYFEDARNIFREYFSFWKNSPLLKLAFHPGIYTWILFFSISLLIHAKKYSSLYLMSLPIGVLIICFLSPLNGSLRYSMPIISSVFFFLAYTLDEVSNMDIAL